ncbi:MAG: hypothetical protein II937_10540 [Bacteroidales bacterium]|nr:hypothetical protein [Bacteroidales bacterium]
MLTNLYAVLSHFLDEFGYVFQVCEQCDYGFWFGWKDGFYGGSKSVLILVRPKVSLDLNTAN